MKPKAATRSNKRQIRPPEELLHWKCGALRGELDSSTPRVFGGFWGRVCLGWSLPRKSEKSVKISKKLEVDRGGQLIREDSYFVVSCVLQVVGRIRWRRESPGCGRAIWDLEYSCESLQSLPSFSFIFLHFPSSSFIFLHFPSFSFIFLHFPSFS